MGRIHADIPGGFAKSYRKELDSEIWLMPPLYHRVWYWLRMNVQYDAFLFPTHGEFGIWVLPGQRLTSLQQIADGVKWVEWGREVIPNKKTIRSILDWLKVRKMVTLESNAKGTLITLVNWHIYNSLGEGKVTGSSIAEETRPGHKEERKKGEEGKDLKHPSSSGDEAPGGESFLLTKKKRKLAGKRLETFNLFWDAFGYKTGKAEAADSWFDIPSLTDSLVSTIVASAKKEAARRQDLIAKGKTPKMAQGWLSGRRWEDEAPAQATSTAEAATPPTFSPVTAEESHRLRKAMAKYDN